MYAGAWTTSSTDSIGTSAWRSPATFTNPLYPGADPWVVRCAGEYFLCQADARGAISVWRSSTLIERGEQRVVWTPPARGWNRRQVWAPELHHVDGRWYIYYAASNGRNAAHRMGVLQSVGDDPQGQYIDLGMMYTGDDDRGELNNRWAIDGTLLPLRGRLYFVWSGWEGLADVQHLYIAGMADPATIGTRRVQLCDNDTHLWERVSHCPKQRGLCEGPQALHRHGKVFLIYSCSASWQCHYKLGMLVMDERSDPLDPRSWTKVDQPVFESSGDVVGVGHCCFTQSPDGAEDWIIYHAKQHRREGWERTVRAQKFSWDARGYPVFGQPVPNHQPVAMPSGDAPLRPPTPAPSAA